MSPTMTRWTRLGTICLPLMEQTQVPKMLNGRCYWPDTSTAQHIQKNTGRKLLRSPQWQAPQTLSCLTYRMTSPYPSYPVASQNQRWRTQMICWRKSPSMIGRGPRRFRTPWQRIPLSPYEESIRDCQELIPNPAKERSHAGYPQPYETSQCPNTHLVNHH